MPTATATTPPVPVARRRFYAVLAVFLAWVAALALMAQTTASRPTPAAAGSEADDEDAPAPAARQAP